MLVVPKHHFLPESPSAPFKAVFLDDLKRALLAKKLGRFVKSPARRKVRDPFSGRFVWSRPAHHPLVVRAERWCSSELLRDLQSGSLIGFTNHKGSFYRILAAYWKEPFVGLSLEGHLFDINGSDTFPGEFSGSAIFVFEEYARAWLRHQKITQDDLGFPEMLRTRPPRSGASYPSDEQVRELAIGLKMQGHHRDEIAKKIRSTPGFERITNESARKIMRGLFPLGRPKKAKHA